MDKGFSLASLLGKGLGHSRLPDLGTRELSVLEVLWEQDALTCQAALERLPDADLSLSTVQSTFERLHRKDLVTREKVGRCYVYRALVTRENIISRLMHDIAESLTDGDAAPMVSGFLDYLGESDQHDPRIASMKKGRSK